jgi:hypothetical protein
LRNNALRQAFRNEAAVHFLRHLEDQFIHLYVVYPIHILQTRLKIKA